MNVLPAPPNGDDGRETERTVCIVNPLTGGSRESARRIGLDRTSVRRAIRHLAEDLCRSGPAGSSPAEIDAVYREAVALFMRLLASRYADLRDRNHDPDGGTGIATRSDDCGAGRGGTAQEARRHSAIAGRRDLEGARLAPFPGAGDLVLDVGCLTDATVIAVTHAARLIARENAAPHAILSEAYESLLRLSPRFDRRAGLLVLENGGRRRARGAYYTPDGVARLLAEAALDPLVADGIRSGRLPQVLDPAMGTGVFLLEAVRHLHRKTGESAARIAETCLSGVDLDPLAVEIAVLGLWLETGARPALLARRLRAGDSLASRAPAGRHDAVLSNPPWGIAYATAERARLAALFPESCRGGFDSFKLFLDLGVSLSRGTMGMVVPHAVLGQSAYCDVRAMLLRRMDPYAVFDLGDGHFPGAAAPACGLVWGPKPGPDPVRSVTLRRRQRLDETAVPRSRWSASGGFPRATSRMLDLVERLQSAHPLLGDLRHLYQVRDVGINYNRAALGRRVLYDSPQPHDPRDMPRYRGRDFDRYTPIRVGGWLRHGALDMASGQERLSVDLPVYRRAEKIVFRQTADRIVATLDRTRMAFGRSVIAITAEGEADLLPLLACLNSSPVTALYRTMSGESGRVLPQVKVGRMRVLPIPGACLLAPGAAPREEIGARRPCVDDAVLDALNDRPAHAWAWLGELAGERLQARDGGLLDARIDRLVSALYGLTEHDMHDLQEQAATGA